MNLGNRLYELRKQKNMSQEEAAEKLQVTRQTISKWETNQSQPDFDKIIPICELYGITVDKLFGDLKGSIDKKEYNIESERDLRLKKRNALVVSGSVFLYFIAVIWVILASNLSWLSENVMISIFLLICAIATVILIFNFMTLPKQEKEVEKKRKEEIEKYDGIIAIFFTCIYLLISFLTQAWHLTWLIWIVFALVIEIVHLILGMKGNKNDE